MHYRPTPFRAAVDENLPKHVAGTRAALFHLLRDQPHDPEACDNTEAVRVRRSTPKPQPEPEKVSRWDAALHEDSFVFSAR